MSLTPTASGAWTVRAVERAERWIVLISLAARTVPGGLRQRLCLIETASSGDPAAVAISPGNRPRIILRHAMAAHE